MSREATETDVVCVVIREKTTNELKGIANERKRQRKGRETTALSAVQSEAKHTLTHAAVR